MLGQRLRRYLVALVIGALALTAVPAAGFGQADRLQNLEPGKRAELNEKVPVNFVFVGYERGAVDAGKFRAGLPDRYKPIVRSRYCVWFHDLSAGPDSFTDSWNVDDPDLTGDGVKDYRMPPIWEYFAPGGYRSASMLTGDLSKISRYVAIDLFLTSSPLYPPQFTPRLLPNKINLDVNTIEGIPNTNASKRYQTPGFVVDEISELHRLPYSIDQQDLAYKGRAKGCYVLFLKKSRCFPKKYPNYPANAKLNATWFLFGAENLSRLLDDERSKREYEAVLINWAVPDGPKGQTTPPLLGFADENYRSGTQSFVFGFISPDIAQAYGLTTTEIHEYGHHLNLCHPFDGFDYETGTDFDWEGKYYFAGVGNENNTMMSYADLNWDFSQFDRDNTNRFQAAAYINNASALAERIRKDPNANRAADDLAAADKSYGAAKKAIARHDYVATFKNARAAYEHALRGARDAGVPVEASNSGRTAITHGPHSRARYQVATKTGRSPLNRISRCKGRKPRISR